MLDRRQRILYHYKQSVGDHQMIYSICRLTVFHIQVDVYLVQNVPHIRRRDIGQHHEFDTRQRLIVMQLILSRPKRYEASRPLADTRHYTIATRTCHYPLLACAPYCAARILFRTPASHHPSRLDELDELAPAQGLWEVHWRIWSRMLVVPLCGRARRWSLGSLAVVPRACCRYTQL